MGSGVPIPCGATLLAGHFVECGTRRVHGARITVYVRPGGC